MFNTQSRIIVASGFAALLLLMFAVITIGYNRMAENQQVMGHLIESQHQKINLVLTMHSTVQSRAEQALLMANASDPFERDNAYIRMSEQASEHLMARNSLSSLVTDERETDFIKNITELSGRTAAMLYKFIDLISESHNQQAKELLISRVIPAQNILLTEIRTFLAHENDIAQLEINLTKHNYQSTLNLLSYIVFVAALLSTLIVWFVIRKISRAEDSLFAEVALQSIGDAVITTDAAGKVTYLNSKAIDITELDGKSAIGKSLVTLFDCYDAQSGEKKLITGENQLPETAFHSDTRFLVGSDDLKDIEYSMSPIRDHNAVILGTVMAFRDITKRNEIQKELRLSQERLSLVLEGTNDGVWDYTLESSEIYFSSRWKEMLGYTDTEFENSFSNWQEHIHPDDLGKILLAWSNCTDGDKDCFNIEYRMQHKDRNWIWIECRGLVLFEDDGKPIRLSGSHTDINARKNAEQDLFTAKQHAEVTLRSIGDAVITVDLNGTITFMNAVAESLSGWSNENAIGRSYDEIILIMDEETRQSISTIKQFNAVKIDSTNMLSQIILINRENIEFSIEQTTRPLRNDTGCINGFVTVLRDVSTERKLKHQLYWQANHDGLTGLYNRTSFENRLTNALEQARTEQVEHALLYMDLDQFKVVNDTCGHIAGDELLRQLANTLQQNIRQTDTLARLGGDEFGILLDHCSPSYATYVAHSIRETISEFRFAWDNKTFEIGVCIGVVPINGHSAEKQNLMAAADIACYTAKDLGRNRVHVFEENDNELNQRHGEMRWVSRITEALQQDRFVLYKQAIVSINPRNPNETHYEILVRMLDDDGSIIPPGAFIPAAERYNMMPAIDRWVIRNLFSEYTGTLATAKHKQTDEKTIYTINLSGNSINDTDFLEFVHDMMSQYNLPPDHFCFEITETSAIANLSSATTFIQELKKIGCLFALDDFGSGLSSFGYLKNLPVDFLKIDGQFVKDIVDDPIDDAMVRSINEIGHVMGMQTIAEFVENEAILNRLKDIGVDFAQGYGVAKPEPLIVNEQRKTAS